MLTNLQNIRELRVVSRTSVLGFRDTNKNIRAVARDLGVAFIVEGSVRRAGNTVRVTGQLIDARTDAHLWANKYERELSAANVFAIQSELAQDIARELKTALSPEEKRRLEQRPTENLAAYDLFLQAREITNSGSLTPKAQQHRVALLENAVKIDPAFANGWAWLSHAHAAIYSTRERTRARREEAKKAIELALKLQPDSAGVIRNLGYFYYACEGDWPKARLQFERLLKMTPSDGDAYFLMGNLERREGKWLSALANLRVAVKIDPGDGQAERILREVLLAGRRYDDALAVQRPRAQRRDGAVRESWELARISFLARGAAAELDKFYAGLPPDQLLLSRQWWARVKGDYEDWKRWDREFANLAEKRNPGPFEAALQALVLAMHGETAGANQRIAETKVELRTILKEDPLNPFAWRNLGLVEAAQGRKEEALRTVRKAIEILPETRDSFSGPYLREAMVYILVAFGEKELALAEVARLLRLPNGLNVHEIRNDLLLRPLRSDPRFEALLNDPKNNAPLF